MRVALSALAAFALATNAPAAEPEVRAVRATTVDFRVALRVLTSEDVPPGTVVREGGEIVIRVSGTAPEGLALPRVEKPLGAIRIVREPGKPRSCGSRRPRRCRSKPATSRAC